MNFLATDTTLDVRPNRIWAIRLNRLAYAFARHWFLVVTVVAGLYVGLPWLAPVLMKIGWNGAANALYAFYSTQCHQLPQRSFFLFGSKPMYSLSEIQSAWKYTNNPMILRQFIGNDVMGWKVAWSDRMVSLYTSMWAGIILARLLGKRLKALPWWTVVLLALPIAVDGGTHFISDLGGIGQGFRDSNAWLAILTNNIFPSGFYAGDALGSFNSLMRLFTGVLFGLGLALFAFPYLESFLADTAREIEEKFQRVGIPL
jgi:uncharacterized membrane protein